MSDSDNNLYIPRGAFNQYFTKIFVRNNKNALYEEASTVAKELQKQPEDIDQLIYKAVYAAFVELYSNNMMSKQDSIADLVRKYIANILQDDTPE